MTNINVKDLIIPDHNPERVRLFIDVDGVINVFSPDSDENAWGASRRAQANGFTIHWFPEMIEKLADLDVDKVWATTWQDKARLDIAPLIGIGSDWPVLRPPRQARLTFPSIGWKVAALVADWADNGHEGSFISLDDEHTPDTARVIAAIGGLAIATDPEIGIQPWDLDRIQNYIG